jgi:hypothetical protein
MGGQVEKLTNVRLKVGVPTALTPMYCSAYPTLHMTLSSSEMSVDFQRISRRCIPEGSNLQLKHSIYIYCSLHKIFSVAQ